MDSKLWSIFRRYKKYNGIEGVTCTLKIKDYRSEARECGRDFCIGSEEMIEVYLKVHLYRNHFDDYRRMYPRGSKKIQEILEPQYGFIEPQKLQNYCFSIAIIRYIQKTAKPKVSWKLAHTAKAFVDSKIFQVVDRLGNSEFDSQWKTFDLINNHEEIFDPKTFKDKIVFLKFFGVTYPNTSHLQMFLHKTPIIFCLDQFHIARQKFSFEEYLYLTSTARHISLSDVCIQDSELQIVPLEALLKPLTSRVITFELIHFHIVYYTSQTFLKLSTMKFKKLQVFNFKCAPSTIFPQLLCKFIENNPTLTYVRLHLKLFYPTPNPFHQYVKMWIDETYEKGFGPEYNGTSTR